MKLMFVIGTITVGGRDEVRIYVREPFGEELKVLDGKTLPILILIPETYAELLFVDLLKKLRIRG